METLFSRWLNQTSQSVSAWSLVLYVETVTNLPNGFHSLPLNFAVLISGQQSDWNSGRTGMSRLWFTWESHSWEQQLGNDCQEWANTGSLYSPSLFPVNSTGFISKCFSAPTITRKLQTARSLEGGRKGGVARLIILIRWARDYHICTK